MPRSSAAEAPERVLGTIRDRARKLAADNAPRGIDPRRFVEIYYRHATDEDLSGPPESLAAAALSHLGWGAERRRRRPLVRVFNPDLESDGYTSEHTIVEIVTDDSPFIVDSVTMRLNAASRGVLVKIHPILHVDRDGKGRLLALGSAGEPEMRAESWAHFEIARVVEPALLARIEQELKSVLRDVGFAVRDWPKMVARLRDAAKEMRRRSDARRESVEESALFLDWLASDHLTLIGYCRYEPSDRELEPVPASGLGLLRPGRRLQDKLSVMDVKEREASDAVLITKTPLRSTIHRPAPLDDISIAVVDADGGIRAEHRFVGLFTSTAYNESPSDIPLLRMKVRRIMERSGLDPVSHRGKALRHIVDTLPRDELIQAPLKDLEETSLGILGIEERRRVRLFCRRDTRNDFYSCLVYLPRDQYSRATRTRIESLLEAGLGGHVLDSQLAVSESTLARLHLTIRIDPGTRKRPRLDRLQAELREAAMTWTDRVREALLARMPEIDALAMHERFTSHFPVAYQEALSPARACRDMPLIGAILDDRETLQMAFTESSQLGAFVFSALRRDGPIELYRVHPILENMGVRVVRESNYRIGLEETEVWVQDFELETAFADSLEEDGLDARFQECFARTLAGEIENDGFNSLVINAGLDWRTAELLRACCKYIQQSRLRFSQAYMLETLLAYPEFTRALVELFASHFDPDLATGARVRRRGRAERMINAELDRADSLDHDRILRAFASVVQATLRTNFYQRDESGPKPYLSFKLDPKKIPYLPQPRPVFEIFVYSQRTEGVHLRCGRIARGGLRWSDRREDFRTEILGLMKAQQVKNTVIVPAGAKGGFVCKQLPSDDRAAIQAEVVACYQTFVRGLLDLTDNIVAEKPVSPPRVIARDEPDPYLVVAADKGTATFSDIANELSKEYGFWLGDAFASGGSAGYDHKRMAITARGAWESVKRHFRELGIDTQSQEFTVVGIGDMAGDVFGNGMLLSPHIRLVAAFNHMHIFLDPNPDPAASFAERKRLFELPRSSWDDYDRSKLSPGGDIYERRTKSITLHPAAQAALGIETQTLTPPELIQAILRAPVDLLWNGGIGTYVKASREAHVDAGDPPNDALRIDGRELRCRVVGEGGNLGLTQLGRIEYALAGGRLNTDFIDNSGGVDSSDREVNIKILLNDAINAGRLDQRRRNALLARMTDSVAGLVLASNYAQTQALSMMASRGNERLGEHGRLIRLLEARGLLDRALEFLPSEEEIEERRKSGATLTRPELAVILSYAKIHLFDALVASDIPEEPHCAAELEAYFPKELGKRFGDLVTQHRLHREISAMLISSSMVNRMGPFFVLRAQDDTGADCAQVARAYAIIRALFGTRRLWRDIEALDGRVQAEVQYDSFFQVSRMVRRAVYWILHRYPQKQDIDSFIDRMRPGMTRLLDRLPGLLCGLARRRFEHDTRAFEELGMTRGLGERIAAARFMTQLLDIVELSLAHGTAIEDVAWLYFELGRGLKLDWIREQIEDLRVEGHWRALARGTLRETLGQEQRALVASVLTRSGDEDPAAALTDWLTSTNAKIARMKQTFDEMQTAETMDFATISIALKELSRLR